MGGATTTTKKGATTTTATWATAKMVEKKVVTGTGSYVAKSPAEAKLLADSKKFNTAFCKEVQTQGKLSVTPECTSTTSRRRLEGRLLAAKGATVTTTYTANLPKTATVDTAALKTAVQSITPAKIVAMAKTSGLTVAAPSAITATTPTAVVKKVAVTTTKAPTSTESASFANRHIQSIL